MGRKSTYDQKVADIIVERLASGTPLAEICRDDEMPAYRTVYDWAEANPPFAANIARAREDGHEAIAARTRQTARGKTAEEGGDSSGDIQRDKLIIDTDLKLLSKWNPKKYGDRTEVEHSGQVNFRAWMLAQEQ